MQDLESDMIEDAAPEVAPENQGKRFPGLTLCLENKTILARLTASGSVSPLTGGAITEAVKKADLALCFIDEEARNQLISQSTVNEAYELELGEKRDASMEIKISADKIVAELVIEPPMGGVGLSADQLITALVNHNLVSDLLKLDVITELAESVVAMTAVVAEAQLPVHGEDAQFVPLFYIEVPEPPDIGENDIADYFETKHYAAVKQGDEIMRRIPATEGVPGITVLGKILKANKGKNQKLKKHKGSRLSEEDEDILIADINGHPVISERGVMVSKTLTLAKADIKSGNVHFDGSIVINGDVESQLMIEATGDIFVKGTVSNATLIAGGNIVIGGGVLSESVAEDEVVHRMSSKLDAGLDVHAKFLNLTSVKAGRSISIQSYCMQCRLESGLDIMLGEKGGIGSLICGRTHALHKIKVHKLGSPAYLDTIVSCGSIDNLQAQLVEVKRQLRRRHKERSQLKLIGKNLDAKQEPEMLGQLVLDKKQKVESAMKTINIWLRRLDAELNELHERQKNAKFAAIEVSDVVYPNSSITINGAPYQASAELGKTTFYMVKGQLKIK